MDITDTQLQILALIAQRIEEDGLPPSQSEIAQAMGFSGVRAAQYHLEALEATGAVYKIPGKARGLRLTPEGLEAIGIDSSTVVSTGDDSIASALKAEQLQSLQQSMRLPVLGRVAAGLPIGADVHSDEFIMFDRVLFFPSPDYLLRVRGDSMIDEGIFDGDLIGVHRTNDARNGQIVIARIDDEITVKLLKRTKDRILLLPRNPDFEPIEVPVDADFGIEGLYCGLIRSNR